MSLADFEDLTDALVRDGNADIGDGQRGDAIQAAVRQYGRDRPRTLAVDTVSAAGGVALDLPAGWEDGFSVVASLEYPVGDNPPSWLDAADWSMYQAPGGWEIRLAASLPAGATVRTRFTARHALTPSSDTIPADDREAVSSLAAALLLDQLAARFAGASEPTIGADAIDHGSKSGEYARRAAGLRKRYQQLLKIDPDRTAPAGTVVNLDLKDSRGRDRLTHPNAYR